MQPHSFPPLTHFMAMMGPHGLYQHATERAPLLSEGYCTDDNARAVNVLLKLKDIDSGRNDTTIDNLLAACWQFVVDAEDSEGGLYNFRDANGVWLTHGRSEDMYARVLRACAALISAGTADQRDQARKTFSTVSQHAQHFIYVRSAAETLVACSELPPAERGSKEAQKIAEHALSILTARWQQHASTTWPWFEQHVTYANALLPHGLLAAEQLGLRADNAALRASTEFLIATTMKDDVFIPVGSRGWYSEGGTPSIDNQQPIEAGLTFDFLIEYQKTVLAALPPEVVAAPYLWFFGKNTGQEMIAQENIGASFDGLFLSGLNRNCGAESMLAYLWTELRRHDVAPAVTSYLAAERERLQKEKSR